MVTITGSETFLLLTNSAKHIFLGKITKKELMMKRVILLGLLLSFLFFGCGGSKPLEGAFRTEGIVISYEPSVGISHKYENLSDEVSDVITKQQSYSILSKSESTLDIKIDEVTDEHTKISYTFGPSETGTFVNGELQDTEEQSEIVGQTLSIYIGREDGKMIEWEGLYDLEFDEAGMDEAEGMANNYSSILFDYFPPEKVAVGSKWDVTNEAKTTLEDGGFNQQKRIKEYELVDFVEYKGHKCAKVKVTITIDVNTETTGEDADGVSYDVVAQGNGEGKGEFYFDFENGHLVESKYDWIIDLEQTATNVETGEEQTFNMFQEMHEKYAIVE